MRHHLAGTRRLTVTGIARVAAMEPGRDWSTEINTLIDQVTRYYVFPDVGEQVSDVLRQRLADGDYRGLADEQALGDAVTVDMQSVNGDQHLFLVHRDN